MIISATSFNPFAFISIAPLPQFSLSLTSHHIHQKLNYNQCQTKKRNPMDHEFYSETEISQDVYSHLKIAGNLEDADVELEEDGDKLDISADDGDHDDDEEEEDFSFNCGELNTSPIAAEDAFINGQIKSVFPLFGRDSAFSGDDSNTLHENLPVKPPVKKIFVETNEDNNCRAMTSSEPGGDEIVGPYCEWSSRKAVEASPDQACKKSNSTGFSKIWRFKEFVGRCNSDGRDAFVFLNNGGRAAAAPTPSSNQAVEEEKSEKTAKIKRQVKKSGKSTKTASLSAHEAYLRSKAKEEERRRSYLPYRPELMGFFTNVNGGLTRNVHPF